MAKYINSKATKRLKPINNLQLQNLLYNMQKSYLQEKGEILFEDPIQAWGIGPIVLNVYRYYSIFGAMPIIIMKKDINKNINNFEKTAQKNNVDLRFLNELLKREENKLPWEFSSEIKKTNSPWEIAYNENREISPKLILSYSSL